LWFLLGTAAQASFYTCHLCGLTVSDFRAKPPRPDDVCRVAQLDERMIPVEVAECFRIYSGADCIVQFFGGAKQFLGLENAAAVTDPPSVLAASEAKSAADGRVLPVLKNIPDTCDRRRLVLLTALRQRQARGQAAEPLECSGENIPRVGHLGSELGDSVHG
jgi:hypothetical protein